MLWNARWARRNGSLTSVDDHAFPRLHGRPRHGWLNDPNGLAYVDGRWHVFFQHNPAAPRHDAIAWGHTSSADLVTWTEEPLAFGPRPGGPDALGCWSGCVTVDDGVPTALYTGVSDVDGPQVLLARSDRDLRTWTREEPPAVGMPDDPAISDVRDPYVVQAFGRRYVVQGAGHHHGDPSVLVYDAEDLTSLRLLGPLLTAEDPVAAEVAPANIWECPNLVPLGDRWLLVVSLWRLTDGEYDLAGVRYLVGDLSLSGEGPRFAADAGGEVDTGPCFYAPQLLVTDGRVLLWGWAWERERPQEVVDAGGWSGCLTFPRVLSLEGDRLVSMPAPEITGLRATPLTVDPGESFEAAAFELSVDAGPAGLVLVHAPGDEELVARWDEPTRCRLLVDGSMVEAFPGGGLPHTTRGYPRAGSRWRVDAPRGGSLSGWHLAGPSGRR